MDCLLIEGGSRLNGDVEVPSAKNAALPLLCLSLLTEEPVHFTNIPDVADMRSMLRLLKGLGVERLSSGALQCAKIASVVAPYEEVKKMRASILVLGPLLARAGAAEVSLPGGCAIGERPVDIHLKGLQAMGATIDLEGGYIKARCKKLKGCKFVMHFPSVTGTINLVSAAVFAEGETVLENCAREPEVAEVCDALIKMGAKITGHGSSTIKITGVNSLKGMTWQIQPDRIQLLTYLGAGAITGGSIRCFPYRANAMNAVLQSFREMGCEVVEGANDVRLTAPSGKLKSIQIETAPFPGFPTDAQAQFMACLTVASPAGAPSMITEKVFENRFGHVGELRRMGAQIQVKGNMAVIEGVEKLSAAHVMASDLRASASLVLAGLAAEGKTKVSRVYHLDRGYEKLEEKLNAVGAKVRREKE